MHRGQAADPVHVPHRPRSTHSLSPPGHYVKDTKGLRNVRKRQAHGQADQWLSGRLALGRRDMEGDYLSTGLLLSC